MQHLWLRSTLLVSILSIVALANSVCLASEPTSEQIDFFESRIRPVLVEHCYSCHNSTAEAAASLALDSREGLLNGGDNGPIVVSGKPEKSRLLAILRHDISDLKMPQDGPKLSDDVVADFKHWIVMGAPDPRDMPPTAEELQRAISWEATFAKRKEWWSFQPVVKPPLPTVRNIDWSPHPVDRFLLAAMEAKNLAPAGRAAKRALLRRLSYVLTGLPPTPEEVRSFLADGSGAAYETQVDRLLNSPRFGERWARHWMDLFRYCESHGSQGDPELANAYRYRDYLIRAFNQDVPYDQLVREHIAGDLLPEPRWNTQDSFNESAIGPAHLRMVELGFVPVDALEDQVKVVDNQIDVYSKAFLGLTASCARCHHHKFDPISQEDFYALYGIFVSGRPGQVLIDAPDLLATHQSRLTSLKQTIRDGLAVAWLNEAEEIAVRLHQQSNRAERLASLRERIDENSKAIATIEEPGRVIVLATRRANQKQRPREDAGTKSRPVQALPTPYARWSFAGNARDGVGSHHGQLLDGAVVRDGKLVLDGQAASMRTSPLDRDIREKTLEAWVSLTNLTQRGIGVIGLDTPADQTFDAIVFGERKPKHWMAGSDFFRRTEEPGGLEETVDPDEQVHVAIVYALDNSITLYRNGQLYGKRYVKGTLQPFFKGKSRFLFGQRLSGVNPPLAGEIEEARAYTRALTPAEIAASYEAGPAGVTTTELLAVLEPEQRVMLTTLHETRAQLREEFLQLDPSGGERADPWAKAFDDARTNKENPLHAWLRFAVPSSTRVERDVRWKELADEWRNARHKRREFNGSKDFQSVWDLKTRPNDWFGYGSAFPREGVVSDMPGAFTVEPVGNRVVTGIHGGGVFSHRLSNRNSGVLSSPRFVIESNAVMVRAHGKNARVRLVIENYPRGNGGIYPAVTLNQGKFGWHVLNSEYRKGQQAYLQIETDLTDRAHFAIDQVVISDNQKPPLEDTSPGTLLFDGKAPATIDELAELYSRGLQRSVRAWQSGSITGDEVAFLDFFVRHDLLPTSIAQLSPLREPLEHYRELEKEIPVPRRVPGVLETVGFNQPLFERGRHSRPGQPIPRRGLSLFSDRPFNSLDGGRLQLAEQTASPANPLTSRVFVNRLWHHTFGQGIVRTVDNFGHLGERPSHPELLDYLAARFVEEDWSIRKMLRLLVTSQAFQQRSTASDAAIQSDPANRYLSHISVRRLSGEAIRDSILATSGQLDFRMYGPGVNVYYTAKTEGGGPKGPLDGDRRRSVYLRIRRNAHNPFLEAFDAPKPTTTRGRRDVTNVPAQSLTMLNGPFVTEQAAKWSGQLVANDRKPSDRIRSMYQRAFAREPTPAEMQATLDFVAALHHEHASDANDTNRNQLIWQDVAHALFCLKEFIYVE
jgi:hypothetical protein